MTWTQHDQDLRSVEPTTLLVILAQRANRIVYVVEDNASWSIHSVDTHNGTASHGRATYRCFIEAKRAHDAGAVIWTAGAEA
jgi:hypothetical protein